MMKYVIMGLSLLLTLSSGYIVYLQARNNSLRLEVSRIEISLKMQNEAVDALALDYARYAKEVDEKDRKASLRYKKIRLKDLESCEAKLKEIEKALSLFY